MQSQPLPHTDRHAAMYAMLDLHMLIFSSAGVQVMGADGTGAYSNIISALQWCVLHNIQ